jgi:putative transposase
MKRKRYADEQIAFDFRQAETGTSVEEICRKMGVAEPTSTGGRSSSPGWAWLRSGGRSSSRRRMRS